MSNSAFIEFILMANSGQNTAKTQRREQKKVQIAKPLNIAIALIDVRFLSVLDDFPNTSHMYSIFDQIWKLCSNTQTLQKTLQNAIVFSGCSLLCV